MWSVRILMFWLSLLTTPAICQEEDKDAVAKGTSSPDSVAQTSTTLGFIGAGLSIGFDNIEDFKTPTKDDTALCIDIDNRVRPTIITGLLIKPNETTKWHVLLSMGFDVSKPRFLDDLLLGIGYRVKTNIVLAASYDLRMGRKLKPRFRREAASLVKALQSDPKYCARFSQYTLNSSSDDLKDGKQFDGFPLRDPRNKTKWIGGCCDPFVKSYNSAVHIGLMFARPIDLQGLFPPE